MHYRLIYSKNGQQLTCWSDDCIWIIERFIRFHKCGYDVEIWEYDETGSHLLERSLHNEQ